MPWPEIASPQGVETAHCRRHDLATVLLAGLCGLPARMARVISPLVGGPVVAQCRTLGRDQAAPYAVLADIPVSQRQL
jgi:hypothetical protein